MALENLKQGQLCRGWLFFFGSRCRNWCLPGSFGYFSYFSSQPFGLGKYDRNLFEVIAQGNFVAFGAQSRCRVKHRNADIAIFFTGATMDSTDFLSGKELRHRNTPKSDDHLRLDCGYLPIEIIATGLYLVGQGIAILRWATLN